MLELHLQRKQLMAATAQQLHALQQRMHTLHSAAACDGSGQQGQSVSQVHACYCTKCSSLFARAARLAAW